MPQSKSILISGKDLRGPKQSFVLYSKSLSDMDEEVVKTVCSILDELVPSRLDGVDKYKQLITYVSDRAGYDIRHAIDATKIANELS